MYWNFVTAVSEVQFWSHRIVGSGFETYFRLVSLSVLTLNFWLKFELGQFFWKTCSLNLMSIADNWFIIPWNYSDGVSSENHHDTSNSTSALLRTFCCCQSFEHTKFQDAPIRFEHVSLQKYGSHIIVNHCLMNPQTCLCNKFHSSSILLSVFTVVNTGFWKF